MEDRNGNRPTGRVNYVWILAGGYLWYLAFKLFAGLIKGEGGSPAVGLIGGVVFTAAGAFLFLREWKAYQYGKAHIDDPETWSDEPEALPGDGEQGEEK